MEINVNLTYIQYTVVKTSVINHFSLEIKTLTMKFQVCYENFCLNNIS